MNNDHFVSSIFLRDEIDFAHRLDFVFIIWLVWNSALNFFSLWFFSRSFSSSFNYFSSIDCRFDHCEIIISHYFFSLTITMRWSWDDRRRKKRNCWREKHRLNCVVLRARLWIEKEWRVAKILRAKIEFRIKKRRLDVVFKRFEVRFVRLNVYDLFCRSFSKRNDFVFIENDERRFWLWKLRAFELIWRRRRNWRSELTRNERREFRRRRLFELTSQSRRDDSENRVFELIEKLRRSRRKDKKNESRWINATTMKKKSKKKIIKTSLRFLYRRQSLQLSLLSLSSSSSSKKTNTKIVSIILKISTFCLFVLSSSLLLFRR